MKGKITFDDVVKQLFVCRMDCRRLRHSINELRKMFSACGLLETDYNWLNIACALDIVSNISDVLDDIHLKNGSYADDDDE